MSRSSKRYLICTAPRSGSSYLCHLLARTGTLGMRPYEQRRSEYILRSSRNGFREVDWSESGVVQLFDLAFAESATPNGVMGFKVMWEHFDEVIRKALRSLRHRGMQRSEIEREVAATTQFVWLRRRNEIRQAISWAKALQSDGWNIDSQNAYQGKYVYDFPGISLARFRIRRAESGWSGFFERCGIRPLVLYYEDYLSDLPAALEAIAKLLGVPPPEPVDAASIVLKIQADSINEAWEGRYRADSSGALKSARAVANALGSREWREGYRQRLRMRNRPQRAVGQ
ncbi:MAG: Stf0 family sulfotransferase [Acidobacteriota bacterium]